MKRGQSSAKELVDSPLAEAIEWRVRLAELDTETCLEFDAWLSFPANRAAWSRVNTVWDLFEEYSNEASLLGARYSALGDAKRRHPGHFRPHLSQSVGGIAAALLLCLGVLWGWQRWSDRPVDYQTAFGERRVLVLADGSTLSLNSGSEVNVRFTGHF